MTRVKTLLGIKSNIIPHQLLHRLTSFFFVSFTRRPLFQPFGISSFSHAKFKILCSAHSPQSTVQLQGPPSFNASGGMLSTSGALAFFSWVRADLISPLEIGPVLMFRGTSAGRGSGNWLGAGLFNTDSKCLFHRWNWSSIFVKRVPSSLQIGRFWLHLIPLSFRVVIYSDYISLLKFTFFFTIRLAHRLTRPSLGEPVYQDLFTNPRGIWTAFRVHGLSETGALPLLCCHGYDLLGDGCGSPSFPR